MHFRDKIAAGFWNLSRLLVELPEPVGPVAERNKMIHDLCELCRMLVEDHNGMLETIATKDSLIEEAAYVSDVREKEIAELRNKFAIYQSRVRHLEELKDASKTV